MEEKKTFASRMETFFAGKGFYIVLFLCVAVIGVSAWSMLSGGELLKAQEEASVAVDKLDDEAPVPAEFPAVSVPVQTAKPAAAKPTEAPIEAAPPATAAPQAPAAAVEVPATVPVSAPADDYFIWPVSGTVDAPYAMDVPVFNPTMQDWRTHDGVDVATEKGAQVRAVANGTVTAVYDDDLFGTTVVIGHSDGVESVYANLAASPTVSVGQWVSGGQVIGSVGETALGEAGQVCHLHFAMRQNGASVDPESYLP